MLVIDGYNLIRRNQSAFRHLPDLEAQRSHLLKILHSAPNIARKKILVVFDGSDLAERGRKIHFRNIQVIFSGHHRSADQVIQEFIRQRAAREEMEVVTSDREIQRTARDHGVKIWEADRFWQHLHRSEEGDSQESEPSRYPDRELSDQEVQDWLKLFENRSEKEDDSD